MPLPSDAIALLDANKTSSGQMPDDVINLSQSNAATNGLPKDAVPVPGSSPLKDPDLQRMASPTAAQAPALKLPQGSDPADSTAVPAPLPALPADAIPVDQTVKGADRDMSQDQLSSAPAPSMWDNVKNFILGKNAQDDQAKAQNIMAIAKANNLDPLYVQKNYDTLSKQSNMTGMTHQAAGIKDYATMMMAASAPFAIEGAVTAPVTAAAALMAPTAVEATKKAAQDAADLVTDSKPGTAASQGQNDSPTIKAIKDAGDVALDTAVSAGAAGLASRGMTALTGKVSDSIIDNITQSIYDSFQPNMDSIHTAYKDAYGVDPTPGDIKADIKSRVMQAGGNKANVPQLLGALIKQKISPLQMPLEAPAGLNGPEMPANAPGTTSPELPPSVPIDAEVVNPVEQTPGASGLKTPPVNNATKIGNVPTAESLSTALLNPLGKQTPVPPGAADPDVSKAIQDINPTAPNAPKSVISQVRAMGGIDPQKAALAGFPTQDFMENGLFHVLRTGGLSPDDIGTILQNNNVLSVNHDESPSDALMATLKGDQSRLLQVAQKSDEQYEQDYAKWLKENKDNAITIPAEAISGLEADLAQKVNSQPNSVYTGWEDFGQPAAPAASSAESTAGLGEGFLEANGGRGETPSSVPDESNGSTSAVEPKYRLDEPFYSQAAQVIDQKMPNAATPEQIRGILSPANGVKPDELNWLGLDDFLAGKTKVSKPELQEYLKNNQVQVNDVEKGGKEFDGWSDADVKRHYVDLFGEPQLNLNRSEMEQSIKDHEGTEYDRPYNSTKFQEWQLPGGKNYREILLTLPGGKPTISFEKWNENRASWGKPAGTLQEFKDLAPGSDKFKSSHFDEKNILAHVRMNDRIDADGKKNLFIEEVQSDWHQKGKKLGYREESKLTPDQISKRIQVIENKGTQALAGGPDVTPEEKQEWAKLKSIQENKGVPNAPFKKTWHELAMKRMLRYAAEHGYDRLSWTTGEQQNDRYDLSKQVSSIEAIKRPNGDYILRMIDKNGQRVNANADTANVPSDKLVDYVGKDLADKINQQPDESHTYSGVDLTVGGEGMKGFYDQILPSFMNKYAKKWGGKVIQTKIPTEQKDWPDAPSGLNPDEIRAWHKSQDLTAMDKMETVHGIDITPAMRASVMQGQPLFKKAPSWDDLLADKEKYEVANKAGAALIQKLVPHLSDSLVNPAYIYTREGANALGMYFKGQISVKSGQPANVYIHELGHAVFDMFLTPEEKATLLGEGRKFYGKDADVEEKIMRDFEKYYEDQRARGDSSLYTKIKALFKRLIQRIKEFFRSSPDSIKSFYDDILSGKYENAEPIKDYAEQASYKTGDKDIIDPNQSKESLLGPAIHPFVEGVARAAKEIVSVFSPASLVPRYALNSVMGMLGKQNKSAFVLEKKLEDVEKAFDKASKEDKIDFIDRIKTGEPQASPELQGLANMMRSVEDNLIARVKQWKPGQAYKEDHYRVLWKVVPGSDEAKGTSPGFRGVFNRPLEGDKGWAKQSTLKSMSEGISMGGEPISYNPITMWRMAQMSLMKFISAHEMWDDLKAGGYRQFVPFGKTRPEGFEKLNDRLADIYFPVAEGMVKAGEWYVQEDVSRILNNYLAKDWVRSSQIGHSLLAFKNVTTAIELSLSPFHASYVSLAAMSSSTGLGLQKIWNQGMLQGNQKQFLSGLKDIAQGLSGYAPISTAKLGDKAIKYIGRDNFINSKAGQDFIKSYPEAEKLLNLLFVGGGKLAQDEGYKTNSLKAFSQGIRDFGDAKRSFEVAQANGDERLMKKYSGEMAKHAWAEVMGLIPSANEMIMRPIFEQYIPRIKIGSFLKSMSAELVEHAEDLKSGKMTEAELARQVWGSVEARFGEMNFDNLFWNRNNKTVAQIFVRSLTWKYGAIQNVAGAAVGQGKEFVDAVKGQKIPKINRNMAALLGIVMLVGITSEIMQKATTGEGIGEGKNGDLLKDFFDPRYDKNGDRIFLNTHFKDWAHIYHSPGGFISNSLSGFYGRFIEDWNNKDFYNVEIAHPGDNMLKQGFNKLKHLIPSPFVLNNQQNLKLQDAPWEIKLLAMVGAVNVSPGYITKSPALQLAEELHADNMPSKTRTKAQFDQSLTVKKLAQAYSKKDDEAPLEAAVEKGTLTDRQRNEIINDDGMTPLERAAKGLSFKEVATVMDKATPDEIKQLLPMFTDKIQRKMDAALGTPGPAYKDLFDFKKETLAKFKYP